MWEGGLRVPTMIRWNNHVKPNSLLYTPHMLADLGVTFIDIAGIKNSPLPTKSPLGTPGGAISLKNLWLYGDSNFTSSNNWLNFEVCNEGMESKCVTATYNISQWKSGTIYKLVVAETGAHPLWLSEIVSDPTESFNLAKKLPKEVASLLALRNEVRDPLCPYPSSFTTCPLITTAAQCATLQDCTWCTNNVPQPRCIPGYLTQACTSPTFYSYCFPPSSSPK